MKFAQKVGDGGKFKQKYEASTTQGEHSIGCKISNSKTELNYCMKPDGMNKDGCAGAIEVDADSTLKDDNWNASVNLCTGGFELGPMKPWTTVSIILSLLARSGKLWR